MTRKILTGCLIMCCLFSIGNYATPAKAQIADGRIEDLISFTLAEKTVLIPNYQTITMKFDSNSRIRQVYVNYKVPAGGYMQFSLGKNGDGVYEGTIGSFFSKEGEWKVSSIWVEYSDGRFNMYDDVEEGGFYELDEGNFKTTSYPDTAGPIFNGINATSKKVNLYDSANVIVNTYDDYSEIKRVSVQYKTPQGGYVSFEGINIGSNQFKLQNLYLATYGYMGLGQFECVSVTLTDKFDNQTFLYDYGDNFGNADLSGGDFTVAERDVTPPFKPTVYDIGDQDSLVQGFAEDYATVTARIDGNVIETTQAQSGGWFYMYIPRQQAGTKITFTATDEAGNESEQTEVTVQDRTPPSAPEVYTVTDQDTVVAGTAEAGATIRVTGETNTYEGMVDNQGSFQVNIDRQRSLSSLDVIAIDGTGNQSERTVVTVNDKTAPPTPSVNRVTDRDTTVTGTAEVGSSVSVKAGNTSIGNGVANENGSFTVSIAKQKAGSKLAVTAKDAHENTSGEAQVIVQDKTAPAAPKVNAVSDSSTAVTGTTESNATVYVKAGSKVVGKSKATSKGTFSVKIPKQKAGTKLSIVVQDTANNTSKAVEIIVQDKTAPAAPVVNPLTDQGETITGTSEPNAFITAKIDSKVIGSATSDAKGNFSIKIGKQLGGVKIGVTARDKAGNSSTTSEIVVEDKTPPVSPKVNPVTDQDESLTGTAEPNSLVTAKVGTIIIGTATANDKGGFSVRVRKQKAGAKISLYATDKANNVSSTVYVSVTAKKKVPSAPKVNEVGDNTTTITGTAESNSTVTAKVGAIVIGSAKAGSNGQFSMTISKQKAGTKIAVNAKNSTGESTPTTVVVKDKTAPSMPKVNSITDQQTVVTGTAEPNAQVDIKIGTTVIVTGTSNAKGEFKLTIPKQKAGTKIFVTAKDSVGNISAAQTTTVQDKTAPLAPAVNRVTSQSTSVTGTTEANAKLTIKVGTRLIGSGAADAKGQFKVAIAKQKVGTKLSIASTDLSGNQSVAKVITVVQ
ncbi:Ig-like domain-containing protein [Priestia megaterium]|uniref:Ig-like domain-containing protein n=1 Tax=Priestia megaterium TaxID=1404 RepID=UPI002E1A3798|nr:Ig-like domain-containing protein [Priestia megaterium]